MYTMLELYICMQQKCKIKSNNNNNKNLFSV